MDRPWWEYGKGDLVRMYAMQIRAASLRRQAEEVDVYEALPLQSEAEELEIEAFRLGQDILKAGALAKEYLEERGEEPEVE